MEMTAWRGALFGVIIAQGAPLGWLAFRSLLPAWDVGVVTLLYMEVATSMVLGTVGWMLGRRERELMVLNHQLEALARQDGLTGLANASALHEDLQREVARSKRAERPLALVLLDLDHFKRVNDRHGHLVGDQVLRGLGRILRSEARATDLAARYGGEELALILPETDIEEAIRIASRLREAVEEGHRLGFFPVPVTASFGVAAMKPTDTSLGLFAAADRALYQAKDAGRNCVCRAGESKSSARGKITSPMDS